MATPRHRILTWPMVVAALLVGVVLAVVSVPVAAMVHGYARSRDGWFHREAKGFTKYDEYYVFLERHDAPGGRFWSSHLVKRPLPPITVLSWHIEPGDDRRPAFAKLPFEGFDRQVSYAAHGWPLLAAQGRVVRDRWPGPSNTMRLESLIQVTRGLDYFLFPTRPIWSGLLANTLFYAALALAPMVLLRWRRTRRRRARGLCAACGYELGEGVGVCPECGLAVRAS